MSVQLAGEDDQMPINFVVITDVIVNTSAVVALAQAGGTATIPLQQQVNVCLVPSLPHFVSPCVHNNTQKWNSAKKQGRPGIICHVSGHEVDMRRKKG